MVYTTPKPIRLWCKNKYGANWYRTTKQQRVNEACIATGHPLQYPENASPETRTRSREAAATAIAAATAAMAMAMASNNFMAQARKQAMAKARAKAKAKTDAGKLYRTFMRPIVRSDLATGPFSAMVKEEHVRKTLQDLWRTLPEHPQPGQPHEQCRAYWKRMSNHLRFSLQPLVRGFLIRRRLQPRNNAVPVTGVFNVIVEQTR